MIGATDLSCKSDGGDGLCAQQITVDISAKLRHVSGMGRQRPLADGDQKCQFY